MMTTLDGNSIAGTLRAVFGGEKTTAAGTCAACGATRPLAELQVYLDAPGIVARCRDCEGLLLVIVDRHGIACIDASGFSELQQRAGQ